MTVNNNKLQYSLLNVEKPLPTMLKIQIRSLNDPFPSCIEYIRQTMILLIGNEASAPLSPSIRVK